MIRMDTSEAKSRYNKLDDEEKIDFLIRLSHSLTIVGRECYDFDGDGVERPRTLRTINEIQHRIMGAAMELRQESSQDNARDWIVELLLEHKDPLIKFRSTWAFERSMSAVGAR